MVTLGLKLEGNCLLLHSLQQTDTQTDGWALPSAFLPALLCFVVDKELYSWGLTVSILIVPNDQHKSEIEVDFAGMDLLVSAHLFLFVRLVHV